MDSHRGRRRAQRACMISLRSAAPSVANNIKSQPRLGRPQRRLPSVSPFDLELAFINLVATGGEERITAFAAESQIRDSAVRRRDDRVHAPRLIANLNAHTRRNVEPPVAVDAHAVGLAAVNRVGDVYPVILLLELQ
jgi:hypothetical protein